MKDLLRSSNGNPHGLLTVMAVRFSAMGDVAMTVPVLYSACRCYPDIQFVMVTRPSMCDIFVRPPSNLRLVGADVKHDYTGPKGMYRLVAELVKEYRPDAFIDLHDVIRTRLMGLFSRLRGLRCSRIDKGRSHRRALTRRYNKRLLPMVSMRSRYREAFFRIGLPVTEHFNGLYGGHAKAPVADFASITSLVKQPGEQWIGIAPFAAHKGKIYPPEKMERVMELLRNDGQTRRIFLFGGGGEEAAILGRWAFEFPGVVSLAGKRYGFRAELALMNHLDLMVSMDSANMHLAAIAGTRTLSIWGATHPYCGFKGWHQNDSDILQAPLICRPCSVFGDKPCYRGDYLCLNSIKPELIYSCILRSTYR